MTIDRRILQKVLFLFLFFCIEHAAGFIPGLSASMEAKANVKCEQVRPLLIDRQAEFLIPPEFLPTAPEDDGASIRNAQSRRRLRFYQTIASNQFSFSTRTVHFLYDHSPALIVKENKAGVYQHQDSFLPAYYSFLFRCALF